MNTAVKRVEEINAIIRRADEIHAGSDEEHPNPDATPGEQYIFRAVGASRDALEEAGLKINESLFALACSSMDPSVKSVLGRYFESVREMEEETQE